MEALSEGITALNLDAPCILDEWSEDIANQLTQAFDAATIVALDAEGIDLSREGLISIVQLATPSRCFLVDVLGKIPDDPLIDWLRTILESTEITKVIHDCRMDSDALKHHLNIELTNVHDTSCWHHILKGDADKGLNDTMIEYGLRPNTFRDSSVYQTNPRFWTTRPMTAQMIDWASGDVQNMFQLHELQSGTATERDRLRASSASQKYVDMARTAQIGLVKVRNPGKFIGKRGASIRSLQDQTGTIIYNKGRRTDNTFMVFYHTPEALMKVQQKAHS